MEYNLSVKITIWTDGFTSDITARIHYLDSLSHLHKIELQGGSLKMIDFEDVIELSVVD
jgi:hypothetical protein